MINVHRLVSRFVAVSLCLSLITSSAFAKGATLDADTIGFEHSRAGTIVEPGSLDLHSESLEPGVDSSFADQTSLDSTAGVEGQSVFSVEPVAELTSSPFSGAPPSNAGANGHAVGGVGAISSETPQARPRRLLAFAQDIAAQFKTQLPNERSENSAPIQRRTDGFVPSGIGRLKRIAAAGLLTAALSGVALAPATVVNARSLPSTPSEQNIPAPSATKAVEINPDDPVGMIMKGQLQGITVQGSVTTGFTLKGLLTDGRTFTTYTSQADIAVQLRNAARQSDRKVWVTEAPTDQIAMSDFFAHPWQYLLAVFGFFSVWRIISLIIQRKQHKEQMKLMEKATKGGKDGFSKSKAKMLTEVKGKVMFDDVAGVDAAKEDLKEVVDFLRNPKKYQRVGAHIPHGVLMDGPPGVGKTLLARAVAGEANVPFFTISGSDFTEMFVGVGAARVRDMFDQARKNSPCIIFIDEIDALGRARGSSPIGNNEEREQALNQLLVEMDGFEASEGIVLIAATNRPDILDPALKRPGRFDRHVTLSNPRLQEREAILKVHVKKVPLAPDVDLHTIARGTPGFSGADLMNLVNEAALTAARRNKNKVGAKEFEDARDKILMGAERGAAMTEEERTLVAYHEGGHAIVALNVKEADPLHMGTIAPRGRANGRIVQLPERDVIGYSRQWLDDRIAILMGGRAAEYLVNGEMGATTGAGSDIEQATKIASQMFERWGMSKKLGHVNYQQSQERHVSGAMQQLLDQEIRDHIEAQMARAEYMLLEKEADLHTLAKGFLEFETLTGDEIKDLLKGKRPNRETVSVELPIAEPSPVREPEPLRPEPIVARPGFFKLVKLLAYRTHWEQLLLARRIHSHLKAIAEHHNERGATAAGAAERVGEFNRINELMRKVFSAQDVPELAPMALSIKQSIVKIVLSMDQQMQFDFFGRQGGRLQIIDESLRVHLPQSESPYRRYGQDYVGMRDVEGDGPIEEYRNRAAVLESRIKPIFGAVRKLDATDKTVSKEDREQRSEDMAGMLAQLQSIIDGRRLPPLDKDWVSFASELGRRMAPYLDRYEQSLNPPLPSWRWGSSRQAHARKQLRKIRQDLLFQGAQAANE